MKFSRLGIFTLLIITAVFGASCNFYNRIMAQKSLVDGAKSYKERNYKEAEEKFRSAIEYDPEFTTDETKLAQLFLARTVHSEYTLQRDKPELAENAIKEYKEALKAFIAKLSSDTEKANAQPEDEKAQKSLENTKTQIGSIIRSVASLYENLQQDDNWNEWQTTQAENEQLPNAVRATAYVALAAKEYNCANDITDTKEIKKTVKEDGKDVFKFSKPENEEDYEKLQKCVDKGTEFVNKAVELNPDSDSAWSYKASLTEQRRRIADMNGETEKKESLKEEFTKAKEKFQELAKKREEAEAEKLRKEAEAKAKKEGKTLPKEDTPAEDAPTDEAPAEDAPAEDSDDSKSSDDK